MAAPEPPPDDAAPWWKQPEHKVAVILAIIGASGLIIPAIIVAIVTLATSSDGSPDSPAQTSTQTDTQPQGPRSAPPPPQASSRRPARVLLLIDVSGSMGEEPLDPDEPDGDRRMDAVTTFVGPRLDTLDQDGDRIGVWLFTSSNLDLPKDCDHQGSPCKLRRLTYATLGVREALKSDIGALRANDGGTPLYKAMALGVDALRHDNGPTDAVNSLVVITDGFDNTDSDENKSLSELTDAAAKSGRRVQILMTAAGQPLCDDILQPVLDLFGGACEDAQTSTEVEAAAESIVNALRDPYEPPV